MPVREPVDVKFGEEEMKGLNKFVHDNLIALKNAYDNLHTTKYPEWQKLYKGIPKDEERDFPWSGASNVVIQVIGENSDILKASLIGSVYETMPLFITKLVGEWDEAEQGEEQRAGMEALMDYVGLEPYLLDLYRVESLAANDIVQFGTVIVKTPWETLTEELVVAMDSTERSGVPKSEKITKYDGPRPEKLAFDSWAASPEATTIEKAAFKWHKYPLKKQELEERAFNGVFEKAAVTKIINQPDREGPDQQQQEQQQNSNIDAASGYKHLAEWDMYECWFPFWHNNKKYRIIYTMHEQTKIKMRAIFNFYPENEEPWDMGRLGYTDDGLLGYGYTEMLKYYQEEISTTHNQRTDNRTLLNTSIILTGNQSKVDAGFAIYPNACLPFHSDEFSVQQLGSKADSSVPEEELSIKLAKARCGVEPPMQGQGGGTVGKKGYSAMGTLSVMQRGMSRVNINITDFRYLHLRIGRRCEKQYAEFGVGDILKRFGNQASVITKALENIKKGRLEIPIRAANASINKELEKQNDMLLTQVMQRSQTMIAQILQGIQNPMMPPDMRDYLIGTIAANAQLMSHIYRNFGHDDISRLLPELDIVKKLRSQKNGQQSISGGTPQGNGNSSTEQTLDGVNGSQGRSPDSNATTGLQGNSNIPGVMS